MEHVQQTNSSPFLLFVMFPAVQCQQEIWQFFLPDIVLLGDPTSLFINEDDGCKELVGSCFLLFPCASRHRVVGQYCSHSFPRLTRSIWMHGKKNTKCLLASLFPRNSFWFTLELIHGGVLQSSTPCTHVPFCTVRTLSVCTRNQWEHLVEPSIGQYTHMSFQKG